LPIKSTMTLNIPYIPGI